MTQIILDKELRAKLHGFNKPLEVLDESGQLVGFVTPIPTISDLSDIPPLTREEVEAFRRERKGRPLAAMLADWERRA
jgi:hypothetical protein